MGNQLKLFKQFYQVCESYQCVDLSKSKDKYLLPKNHPSYEKIYAAAKDLDLKVEERSKVTIFDNHLYTINEEPNWLIRGARNVSIWSGIQGVKGPESSFTLRVVMNHRLKKVIKDRQLKIIVPAEYLVDAPNPNRKANSKVNFKDFFVASQKLDIYKGINTVHEINLFQPKQQKEMATSICKLIFYSGFMDAHMNNIVLTKDKQLAIVDTEAHGLMHDITDKYSPISLVDARIVGLKEFIKESTWLPKVFSQTAKKYLLWARVVKVIKVATILLSIVCPLIPLMALIFSVAAAKFNQTNKTHEQSVNRPPVPIPEMVKA